MTWFQRLLLITIAATFILVVIGGAVRATDSGLGCPDWPTCHGRLVPKLEKHTLIEYSHRTAATVVGFLFLGVTFCTFKGERRHPREFWLAFTAGVLLLFQIILGGIVVKKDLPPETVALHLGTAMTFIGVMIVTATLSLTRSRGMRALARAPESTYTRLAIAAAAAAFVTLLLGSYVSGTGASVACKSWPACDSSLLGSGGDQGLHMLHRFAAGTLGVLLIALAWAAFDERRGERALVALPLVALGAYLAQALIGAANIWTDLSAGVVVTHLSLAALLWCLLVTVGALSWYLPGRAGDGRRATEAGKVAEWAR
ncbi:MAG TPA: COX15/CtaA family protein [Dehalococcoidia bacterium]|nr:COX15/CtaA family protein [Dehalococcoidia bacterium]